MGGISSFEWRLPHQRVFYRKYGCRYRHIIITTEGSVLKFFFITTISALFIFVLFLFVIFVTVLHRTMDDYTWCKLAMLLLLLLNCVSYFGLFVLIFVVFFFFSESCMSSF